MLTVGDFKDELRAALKRGSAFDDRLGGYMRRAAQWIESNYTLQYMRRRLEITLDAGSNSVPFPPGCKTIEVIKWVGVDSTYDRCDKTTLDLIQRVPYEGLVPSQFYLDGMVEIVFNGTAASDLDGIAMAAMYSNFPRDDDDSHWLLTNAEELMLVQCVLSASVINRDDRTYQMMLSRRDEAIQVLQNADYEATFTGQDIFLSP
jgi:hypothetical protein